MRLLLAVRNFFSLPSNFVISAILIAGFSLRFVGINIGLPETPDPREAIIAQDVLNLIHLTAPPQTYNWPGTAWFYIVAAVGKLLSFVGLPLTEARVILLARCINVLLSTTTLWFTYAIGRHAYNRRVGQIAAGLLAVAMLHATNESRFALVDIPATFCVTLLLWIALRARSPSSALTFRTAAWLGVIVGVGCAVKFTTIFVCFSLLTFIGTEHFYRRLATIIGVSALTFTLLCPYWLIDLISPEWNLFFSDFWYEATHYHQGHFGLISTAESGWLQRFVYLWVLLKWGMGLPLALLVGFGVARALVSLKSRVSAETILLAFVIPYLLFIGIHKVKFARHLLILYPALTVLATTALMHLPNLIKLLFKFSRSSDVKNTVYLGEGVQKTRRVLFEKWIGGIVGSVVVLYSLVYTTAFAGILLTEPTKLEAAEWLSKHIPQEEPISRAPEVLFNWLLPDLELEEADETAKWVLILVPDLEVFQKYRRQPQHYQDEDWYPLNEIKLEETLAFYDRILQEGSRYELHKTFRRTPQFLGIRVSDNEAPFPMRALAHPEFHLYRHAD
ncbi:hypothetical protein C6499_01980 [Candidatus Poribacteria bacterium]|nr:MAG: hypothetical protein C6499_01980 [Candidatus Poribacteria bacterium]